MVVINGKTVEVLNAFEAYKKGYFSFEGMQVSTAYSKQKLEAGHIVKDIVFVDGSYVGTIERGKPLFEVDLKFFHVIYDVPYPVKAHSDKIGLS